jgi:hypothetical protein
MKISANMRALIKKCRDNPKFFIRKFGTISHPMAGLIPFKLFSYQKNSIDTFRQNRFAIYRKCRQSGISTLAGIYALWMAMFHEAATILVVSKRDEDSKDFMAKNIKIPYEYLPKPFKDIWGNKPPLYSAHQIRFNNRSIIKCLPSGADTMRSNSSTLNIIDEAAFCPEMTDMWGGAAPTLIHGGQVIVISTSKGKGNWYHNTWSDAEAGVNEFCPIQIMWWDMDWVIDFFDKKTNRNIRIAPRDGIRECTPEEAEVYGPYWSPWLGEQYRILQEKGEAHLFKEEILAEFLGTGNTVVDPKVLLEIERTRKDEYRTLKQANYINPTTDERLILDFADQLHVWKTPVKPESDTITDGKVVVPGSSGHSYVMGVDIATGEATDYSGVQILDINTQEQVAELRIKAIPKILAMMVDYLARWYNNALVVPERTGIGAGFCQELYNIIGYHNIWRQMMPTGKRNNKVGFPTNAASKPIIDNHLMNMLGEDGYVIYSHRVYKELNIYVYLNANKTGAEPGPGNHDDLVIALGLALIGVRDALQMDTTAMYPSRGGDLITPVLETTDNMDEQKNRFAARGGLNLLMPTVGGVESGMDPALNADEAIRKFSSQIGGLTKEQVMKGMDNVTDKKHGLKIKRGKF